MMLRMSVHFEKENKINNKVKSAMTYPAILSIVAVGAVMFIMTFVMPTFVEMFEGLGSELPLITRFMLGTSEFLSNNLIIILLIIGILIILFNVYKRSPQGI